MHKDVSVTPKALADVRALADMRSVPMRDVVNGVIADYLEGFRLSDSPKSERRGADSTSRLGWECPAELGERLRLWSRLTGVPATSLVRCLLSEEIERCRRDLDDYWSRVKDGFA